MNSAEVVPIRSWPGWSRGRRLAITVARGALWLAAAHPGQANQARPAGNDLTDPLEVAFRVAHEASGLNRPVIEVMAIRPIHVTLMPAPVTPAPPPDWMMPITDSEDLLFVYWPLRSAAVPRRRGLSFGPSATTTPGSELPIAGNPADDAPPGKAAGDDMWDDSELSDAATEATPVSLPLRMILLEPNGGEVWTADSLATIRWQAEGGVEPLLIRLEFSIDDGRSWRLLADSLDNSGSWDWEVPWLESRRARLRVVARDDSGLVGLDATDRAFTLRRPAWIGMTPAPLLALEAGARLPAGSFRLAVELAKAAPVELVILAVTGRLVRRLWDGPMESGHHLVEWDGRGEDARPVASGVYFARLIALGDRMVQRLVLVRGRRRAGSRPGRPAGQRDPGWWGPAAARYTAPHRTV